MKKAGAILERDSFKQTCYLKYSSKELLVRKHDSFVNIDFVTTTEAHTDAVVGVFDAYVKHALVFGFVNGQTTGRFEDQTQRRHLVQESQFGLGCFGTHVGEDALGLGKDVVD